MLNEVYHNCRWCSNNINGKCVKSSEVFESFVSNAVYKMLEEGMLCEAIRESIKFPTMRKLKSLLDGYGISQKRQEEIMQTVGAELEEFIPNMVEEIDDSVGRLILNSDLDLKELKLKDPENFYCKEWR